MVWAIYELKEERKLLKTVGLRVASWFPWLKPGANGDEAGTGRDDRMTRSRDGYATICIPCGREDRAGGAGLTTRAPIRG